jgi:hypothetical protein
MTDIDKCLFDELRADVKALTISLGRLELNFSEKISELNLAMEKARAPVKVLETKLAIYVSLLAAAAGFGGALISKAIMP